MIYADNAATTKLSGTALNAMLPYLREAYGNPSSLYSLGQQAAEALAEARQTVADCLCTEPACGSPGDHLHLRRQRGGQPGHSLRRPPGKGAGKDPHHFHFL